MDFHEKVVLITGASGDIGYACADLFAKTGAKLILHSFKKGCRIVDFQSSYLDKNIYHIICDATDENAVSAQFTFLKDSCGIKRIDVLINNVGNLIKRCAFSEMTWDLMQASLDVNLKSAFLFTLYSAPLMTSGASIIFVSSLTARWGKGDRSLHYGTAKAAIIGMAKFLANELAPKGIRVNTVAPGFIEGQFHERYTTNKVVQEHAQNNPLRRNGAPNDVAQTVLFLASEKSGFINGVTLDVCGGDFIS